MKILNPNFHFFKFLVIFLSVLMGTLMGINLIFGIKANTCLDVGIYLLFYGLYYGVLGRDLAHICTDRLACRIGVSVENWFFDLKCLKNRFGAIFTLKINFCHKNSIIAFYILILVFLPRRPPTKIPRIRCLCRMWWKN